MTASTRPRPTLSVVMPIYNEVANANEAIDRVRRTDLGMAFELIVVDDGSTDGTSQLLAARQWTDDLRLLSHRANEGKGAAVRTGIAAARGEVTAIFDADFEYEPADLANVTRPVLAGEASACFGVRAFEGHTSHSFLYVLGNRFVTLAANLMFNVYLGDVMTCHKAVRTELMQSLPLRANGFDIEPEIAARLIQRGVRIYEVPVEYQARSFEEGKKLRAVDGLRSLAMLLRCRLSPAR